MEMTESEGTAHSILVERSMRTYVRVEKKIRVFFSHSVFFRNFYCLDYYDVCLLNRCMV